MAPPSPSATLSALDQQLFATDYAPKAPASPAPNGTLVIGEATPPDTLNLWYSNAFVSVEAVQPAMRGFNIAGGIQVPPELVALWAGLSIYGSAFIAEIVRSGILALHKGQSEAAAAIGLTRGQSMRLVLLPQALRVIVPPMTSQYLNITKNSSLAIAIGYPDLVASINVTINQTGQAIENVLIIMVAYLTVSLSISLFMNWYNKQIALRER